MNRIRYVFRKLARSPLFTILSILTLALGIGANAAIFSVISGVLLDPLPYPDPDRLVGVWHRAPGLGFDEVNQSPSTYFTYLEESRVFEDIALWQRDAPAVTGLDQPERVDALAITHRMLPLLKAAPVAGRLFNAEDDLPDSPRTVILSHSYWQRTFGGQKGVVGESLTLDGHPTTIVGILPAEFEFLHLRPELFLPLRFDRSDVSVGNFSYQGIARLKPDVTLEQAGQDVSRMIPLMTQKFPRGITLEMLQQAQFAPFVRPLKVDLVGDIGDVLWVLLGVVSIVLLIACANVANLFLVRAEGRHREFGIRTALGADRLRIAGELLSETVTLGLLGGVGGLALAYAGVELLLWIGPQGVPRLDNISINGQVLLFTIVISIVSGILFGLLPIWKHAGSEILPALRDGGRTASEPRNRHFARNALVAAQIAMALVLLVCSGLMVRTFQQILQADPGFHNVEGVLTFRLSVPELEADTPAAAVRVQRRIAEDIGNLSGVRSTAVISSLPMSNSNSSDGLQVDGFPVPEGQLPPIRRFNWISPGTLETLAIPLVAGRDLTWSDIDDLRSVVLVSEAFAREYWNDPREAVGKRVKETQDSGWREIVGVVGDVYFDGVAEPAPKTIYWPLLVPSMWGEEAFARRWTSIAVHHQRRDREGFLAEVRSSIAAISPSLPLARVQGMEEYVEQSRSRTTFTLVMLGIAAAAALLLAAVGIYGVVSYAATQRTREIGIRMALGAARRDVRRLVLSHAVILVAVGVPIGVLSALGLTRLMAALLFGVESSDPLTYVSVAAGLAAITLIASYLPARRATRVDPMEALRAE